MLVPNAALLLTNVEKYLGEHLRTRRLSEDAVSLDGKDGAVSFDGKEDVNVSASF